GSGVLMDKPMCRLCNHRHWSNEPHVWDDEPKLRKITEIKSQIKGVRTGAEKQQNVSTKQDNVSTKPDNVSTIRQIGIRELSKNVGLQFKSLPFEVTKNGKVIARVVGL
ncbi:MAG: hypothetical protein KJ604_20195, partial [Gammaproteobacteria bacterium]|nr:hypothetical protein [Gammaproteobacteria bacterium]